MIQSPTVHIKDSIASQLLKIVFSIYFILTITVTIIHMSAEFLNTKDQVNQELKVIGATYTPGLAKALWDINVEQLQSTFLGIVELPMVEGVKLENERGGEFVASGLVTTSNGDVVKMVSPATRIPIEGYTGLFHYSFPIVHKRRGKEIKVGTGTIYSSDSVVFDEVKLGFMFIVINSIIKTLALWILILLISRRILSRPLADLTAATRNLDLEHFDNHI